MITLSVGRQSARQRPSYALFVPATEGMVCSHLGLEGCRATAAECIRLRCTSTSCTHRPKEKGKDAGEDENDEIPLDDRDEPEFDSCFDQAEAGGSGDEGDEDAGPDAGDCATTLFPYAAPLAVHRKVLSEI